MTVSVLLEGVLKEGSVDEFTQICKRDFQITRAFDGCQGINLALNVENQHLASQSLLACVGFAYE